MGHLLAADPISGHRSGDWAKVAMECFPFHRVFPDRWWLYLIPEASLVLGNFDGRGKLPAAKVIDRRKMRAGQYISARLVHADQMRSNRVVGTISPARRTSLANRRDVPARPDVNEIRWVQSSYLSSNRLSPSV
jgi:hypothetical protein